MRDTTYFRQIPKYTIQEKALTNHLMHEACIKEDCISPMTAEDVDDVCSQLYSKDQCTVIARTCNAPCLPLTRNCAEMTVGDKTCLEIYNEFNRKA